MTLVVCFFLFFIYFFIHFCLSSFILNVPQLPIGPFMHGGPFFFFSARRAVVFCFFCSGAGRSFNMVRL